MKDVEAVIAQILANRADTSWQPSLRAAPDIARFAPNLAGLAVAEDDDLPTGTLVLMGAGVRAEATPASRFEPAKAAGPYLEEMARLEGIITPLQTQPPVDQFAKAPK